MTIPTESEVEQCYGTKRIEKHKDQCERRAECPWGQACLSRANEEADSIHYHKVNVSLGAVVFDPKQRNENASAFIDPQDNNSADTIQLNGISFSADNYDAICHALAKIADVYFSKPTVFEMLMKSIYKHYNQSDLAREKGITRAGVNKRLLTELGIGQKRNDARDRQMRELEERKQEYIDKLEELQIRDSVLSALTYTEWQIYKLVFVDGCTANSAATQLKISKAKARQIVHELRDKLNAKQE